MPWCEEVSLKYKILLHKMKAVFLALNELIVYGASLSIVHLRFVSFTIHLAASEGE